MYKVSIFCGGGEIRTREAVKPQTFQVCGMIRYPTPPDFYPKNFPIISKFEDASIEETPFTFSFLLFPTL